MASPMNKAVERVQQWWLSLEAPQRIHVHVLTLLMLGYLAHYLVFSPYFVEDAGISFAYARNFVEGEGFATFAGGERVEGFSNPLWTWLIAFFYALKIPVWTSSKFLGALFGAVTLPLSYLLARACRPGREDGLSLLAPFFLAASTTFVVWNASGLENSLFSVLLAAGMLSVLREGERDDARPWSALWFLLLALTRPEGILFAALGGFFRLVFAIRRGVVLKPILAWLAVFWIPFACYQAWRFQYFGWEWPNTYYAKMDGENRFKPWKWNVRGWVYVRNYSRAFFLGFALPLYAVAMVGLKDARRWLVLGLTSLGAVVLFWNGKLSLPAALKEGGTPEWWPKLLTTWSPVHHGWDKVRVCFLMASVVLLVIAAARDRGGLARIFVFCIGLASIFFIIVTGGDWMKQWRFFSMAAVPNFVLLSVGVAGLVDALGLKQRRMATAWGLAGLLALPNLWNSSHAAPTPETTVSDVRRRVTYMQGVQKRLHLDHVTLLDVDMGAHMWFSDWDIVDIAGLVDVPMARHLFQRDFMAEYVFEERQPDFAHVHGGWANKSKIPRLPVWKTDYIEIRGYPTGRKSFHVGNHIWKGHLVRPLEEAPGESVAFSGDVAFDGVVLPAPQVTQGGDLFVETWLSGSLSTRDFRLLAFLDDGQGHFHSAAMPPGLDYYAPNKWKQGEAIRGRWHIRLPADLPLGTYGIGFVLMDVKKGEVLQPLLPAAEDSKPRMAAGEIFFEGRVEIVTGVDANEKAATVLAVARESAGKGACDEASQFWWAARHHAPKEAAFVKEEGPDMDRALALCELAAASAADEEERIAHLVQARRHDHRDKEVVAVTASAAAELDAQGNTLFDTGDIEGAYGAWRDAMRLDPRRSATRRKAEEARNLRLGIDPKVRDNKKKAPAGKVRGPKKPLPGDKGVGAEAKADGPEGAGSED